MVEVNDQEIQDIGEESMQCITHPYTKNQGGICGLCLQEKLGKLVTSSSPITKLNNNHLSSPKPFTSSLALSTNNNNNNNLPLLLAKKKKSMLAASSSSSSSSSTSSSNLIYKRSKSTATAYGESFNQRKRSGFWSFFHLYSSKHHITTTTKKVNGLSVSSRPRNQIDNGRSQRLETKSVVGGGIDVIVEEEDDESPSNKVTPTNASVGGWSFGRKVLRSRSVGCGSLVGLL